MLSCILGKSNNDVSVKGCHMSSVLTPSQLIEKMSLHLPTWAFTPLCQVKKTLKAPVKTCFFFRKFDFFFQNLHVSITPFHCNIIQKNCIKMGKWNPSKCASMVKYDKIIDKSQHKHIQCKLCMVCNETALECLKNVIFYPLSLLSVLVVMQIKRRGKTRGWFLNLVSSWQPCWTLQGDLPKFPNVAVNLWVLTSGQQDTERCPYSIPLGITKQQWGHLKHAGFVSF